MGDKVTFGHYRVLQRDDGSLWELGSSAIGVTYKALDTDLHRPVALRVIDSDFLADEANRDGFLREARAAAGLRHSNIASVYHLGKDEEQFFYAMWSSPERLNCAHCGFGHENCLYLSGTDVLDIMVVLLWQGMSRKIQT